MSHHPLKFQPYFEDRDEKRAEIGVLMSGFRLNKTSQYILHRVACSWFSVSWDE